MAITGLIIAVILVNVRWVTSFSCVWSANMHYCLSYLTANELHIHVGTGNNPAVDYRVFPNLELYTHIRDYQSTYRKVKVIDFGPICNVTFNETLLTKYPLTGLRAIDFHPNCTGFCAKNKFCLRKSRSLADAVHYNNMETCKDKSDSFTYVYDTNTNASAEHSDVQFEVQHPATINDTNSMVESLNNSLIRALHLYEVTAEANRMLTSKLEEIDEHCGNCGLSLNRTAEANNFLRKQLGKCHEQRVVDRKIRLSKVKKLMELLYDWLLNIANVD